ncbi:hypothetical protein T10_542 [Trichinella papuae]|uniref:Uncharacterized protein n=1 Tax=Trichinella papuae TaxID=268474 RepID=A0A0V1MKZ8_9BILA|nr:hypothetical protein T10_542 [Trichinella papuae]
MSWKQPPPVRFVLNRSFAYFDPHHQAAGCLYFAGVSQEWLIQIVESVGVHSTEQDDILLQIRVAPGALCRPAYSTQVDFALHAVHISMAYFAGLLGIYYLNGQRPQKATRRSSTVKFGPMSHLPCLPVVEMVVLSVLLSVVVKQDATNNDFWIASTISSYEDACERKKSNNLARCQLLTDYHEHSDF